MKNPHKGSSFDSFLEEEGLYDIVDAIAFKRVLSYELQKAMKAKKCTKMRLAQKMQTSRAAVDRLIDPQNTSITLLTLIKAMHVLGIKLRLSVARV